MSLNGRLDEIILKIFSRDARGVVKTDSGGGGLNNLKGFQVLYEAMAQINQNKKVSVRVHATKFPDCNSQFSELLSKTGFVLHSKLNNENYQKTQFPSVERY